MAQDDVLDKQTRNPPAKRVVYCRRLDRLPIPFVGWIANLFGANFRLPRVHLGIVKYGDPQNSMVVDRWIYRGTHLFDLYDTRQAFGLVHGRYSPLDWWLLCSRHEQPSPLSIFVFLLVLVLWPLARVSGRSLEALALSTGTVRRRAHKRGLLRWSNGPIGPPAGVG